MSLCVVRSLLVGMLTVVLSGCAESMLGLGAAQGAPTLAGEWRTAPDDIGDFGWHQRTLTLLPDGRFASTSASHGLYEGQRRNDLSTWTRVEGTYRVDGDRLHFEPILQRWWDHYEAANFPAPRHAPYPWRTLFDDATFVVTLDSLWLDFNVYPADVPVPVTVNYVRTAARD